MKKETYKMIFFKIMKSLKVLPQKTVIRGFFNKSPDVMLNKPPPPASQEEAHVRRWVIGLINFFFN